MAEELKLDVVIRTQADVEAVSKADAQLKELGKTTDELDAGMARIRETVAKAEAGLKELGEAGEQAGGKLSAGMEKGAGANALKNVASVADVNDLIRGAWQLGSEIGGKIGEAADLAYQGRLDWEHLFGNGDELDATAAARRAALREVREEHRQLLKQLAEPPEDAVVTFLGKLAEAARQTALNLAEVTKLEAELTKAQDSRDKSGDAEARADIEEGGGSEAEKIRARADLENSIADRELVKRDEARMQEAEQMARDADAKERRAVEAVSAEQMARYRQGVAVDILGNQQYQIAKAQGADAGYLRTVFQSLAEKKGFTDLGEDDMPGKDGGESKNVRAAAAAANKAEADAADAAVRERGLLLRNDVASAADAEATLRANQLRTRAAEAKANEADAKGLDTQAGEAVKAAANASRDGEKSTREMAALLKQLAGLIGGKNEAMTAALTDMARKLGDGASNSELAEIKRAADFLATVQNDQARQTAEMVRSMVESVRTSAQIAADARDKAASLEAQVKALRSGK